MGLFSFSGKNKQDRTSQDSGRFSSGDEFAERARAKRASHAGEGARRGAKGGDDPVLPEKKRARRRLVGAIALALAAAVGLPMLLDSEPKPLAGDIAIQIPSKDKAAPLPVPAEPAPPPPVAAADSVDKGEEIVPSPKAARADPQAVAEVHTAKAAEEPAKTAPARPEPVKAEPPKPEHKAHAAESKAAESKPAEKAADKPAPKKAEDKAAHQAPADAARALAILEGKQAADKAHADGEKVTIQVAALGSQEKAAELQARLRAAGIHSVIEKLARPSGDLYRVKAGPYSKDEAEKMHARLAKIR